MSTRWVQGSVSRTSGSMFGRSCIGDPVEVEMKPLAGKPGWYIATEDGRTFGPGMTFRTRDEARSNFARALRKYRRHLLDELRRVDDRLKDGP